MEWHLVQAAACLRVRWAGACTWPAFLHPRGVQQEWHSTSLHIHFTWNPAWIQDGTGVTTTDFRYAVFQSSMWCAAKVPFQGFILDLSCILARKTLSILLHPKHIFTNCNNRDKINPSWQWEWWFSCPWTPFSNSSCATRKLQRSYKGVMKKIKKSIYLLTTTGLEFCYIWLCWWCLGDVRPHRCRKGNVGRERKKRKKLNEAETHWQCYTWWKETFLFVQQRTLRHNLQNTW